MFYYRRSLFVSHTHPPKRIATPRSFYTIPKKQNKFNPSEKENNTRIPSHSVELPGALVDSFSFNHSPTHFCYPVDDWRIA